jgi:hypothetical protein
VNPLLHLYQVGRQIKGERHGHTLLRSKITVQSLWLS